MLLALKERKRTMRSERKRTMRSDCKRKQCPILIKKKTWPESATTTKRSNTVNDGIVCYRRHWKLEGKIGTPCRKMLISYFPTCKVQKGRGNHTGTKHNHNKLNRLGSVFRIRIRIQGCFGSGFGIRIRIQGLLKRF